MWLLHRVGGLSAWDASPSLGSDPSWNPGNRPSPELLHAFGCPSSGQGHLLQAVCVNVMPRIFIRKCDTTPLPPVPPYQDPLTHTVQLCVSSMAPGAHRT